MFIIFLFGNIKSHQPLASGGLEFFRDSTTLLQLSYLWYYYSGTTLVQLSSLWRRVYPPPYPPPWVQFGHIETLADALFPSFERSWCHFCAPSILKCVSEAFQIDFFTKFDPNLPYFGDHFGALGLFQVQTGRSPRKPVKYISKPLFLVLTWTLKLLRIQ